MTVFRLFLIIADALCIATTNSKVVKVLGVVGITFLSIASFLER